MEKKPLEVLIIVHYGEVSCGRTAKLWPEYPGEEREERNNVSSRTLTTVCVISVVYASHLLQFCRYFSGGASLRLNHED